MHDCLSIYWAGAEVKASDIWAEVQAGRYPFEEVAAILGLKCPLCKEALKLRAPRTRTRTLRSGRVVEMHDPAHFYHHARDEASLECDRRSLTREGKEAFQAAVKYHQQQRLEIYNEHLWQMFCNDRNFPKPAYKHVLKAFGAKWCEDHAKAVQKEWNKSPSAVYAAMEEAVKDLQDVDLSKYPPSALRDEAKLQKLYFSGVNLRQHLTICWEIADFLATRTGRYAFHKMVVATLQMATLAVSRQNPSLKGSILIEMAKTITPGASMEGMAKMLAGTHWGEEIRKYLS